MKRAKPKVMLPKSLTPRFNEEVEDMEVDNNDQDHEAQVEEMVFNRIKNLLKNTCRIHDVTPIKKLQNVQEPRLLKNLENNVKRNLQTHADNVVYQCKIDAQKFKSHQSLYIEVLRMDRNLVRLEKKQTPKTSRPRLRGFKTKLIFTGILVSDDSFHPKLKSTNPDDVQLPIFIWHSSTKTWEVLRPELENLLDCKFFPQKFSWSAMTYLSGRWVLKNGLCAGERMKVVLQPIVQLSHLNKGSVEALIDLASCEETLKRLEEERAQGDGEKDNAMQVIKFWNALTSVVERDMSIDLKSCNISKICLRSLVITSEGRVKGDMLDMGSINNVIFSLIQIPFLRSLARQ